MPAGRPVLRARLLRRSLTGDALTKMKLRTEAWLLRGISSLPGELALMNGTLTYFVAGTGSAWPWQLRKLERLLGVSGLEGGVDTGRRVKLFSEPVAGVRAWCPWYYFGGGIKIAVRGVTLRFSFGTPANMKVRRRHLGAGGALQDVADNLGEIVLMRSRGKLWQKALQKAAAE